MSIRLSGPILLATATTNVASNKSVMTYRFRFRIEPDCTAPANSGRLFRFEYDQAFQFRFQNSATPTKTTVVLNGQNNTSLAYDIPFALGKSVHVVGCWDQPQKKQTIWVNGQQVAAKALDLLTGSQNGTIQIGAAAQSPTTVVTLADLLILEASVNEDDVRADLFREESLEQRYTGFVRWHPDLSGADGSEVMLGDPGLVDCGWLGKDLTKLSGAGSATWSADPLDYEDPVHYTRAFVTESGELVKFEFDDGDGNPLYVTDVQAHPTIRVNYGEPIALPADKAIFTDTESNHKTPWVMYELPVEVTCTDVVTFSAPLGWARTSIGGAPQATDQVLDKKIGQLCYDRPEPSTLALGMNLHRQNTWYPLKPYKNLMRGGGWGRVTLDANGKPNGITGGSRGYMDLVLTNSDNGIDDLQIHAPCSVNIPGLCNPEFHQVVWSEADRSFDSDFQLHTNLDSPTSPTAIVTERTDLALNPADGQWRTRVYEVSRPEGAKNHALGLRVSFARTDWTEAFVYGPGEDIADPEDEVSDVIKYYLEGAKVVRFMDYFYTNGSSVATPEDLETPSQFRWIRTRTRGFAFTEIGPVQSLDKYRGVGSNNYLAALVTTPEPHGLSTGQSIKFTACKNDSHEGADVVYSQDGSCFTLSGKGGSVTVIDDTHFESLIYSSAVAGVQSAETAPQRFDPAGSTLEVKLNASPVEYACDVCNAVNADLWLNIPHAATDATIRTLAERVLARLKPGLRVLLEFTNEMWNYASSFWAQFAACSIAAYEAGFGNDGNKWQFRRGMDAKLIFQDVFGPSGHSGDIKLILGWRDGFLNFASYGTFLADQKIVPDYLAAAPYRGFPANWAAATDGLSVSGMHDVWQAMVTSVSPRYTAEPDGWFPQQRAALKSLFPNAELILYEGAIPETAYSAKHTNAAAKSRDFFYHPRNHDTYTLALGTLQKAGIALYCPYTLAVDTGWNSGSDKTYRVSWSHYLWQGQDRGYGDGRDGKARNSDCLACDKPDDVHHDEHCVSVWGQAWHDWTHG